MGMAPEVVDKLYSANTAPFLGNGAPKVLRQIGQLFRRVISVVQT